MGILPNGTATLAGVKLWNNSTPTNASSADVIVDTTNVRVRSTKSGSGTYLPMSIQTSDTERIGIGTAGDITMPHVYVVKTTITAAELAAQLATSVKAIVFVGAVTIDDNLTFPKGTAFIVSPGATISVAATKTLTIRGAFSANIQPVFSGSGSVVGMRQVHPEWFGAGSTSDDITALEKAHTCVLASASSEGGRPKIKLSGTYPVSRTWAVTPSFACGFWIEGSGVIPGTGARIEAMSTFSPAGPVFHVQGQTDSLQRIADWGMSGFGVVPSSGGAGAATIGIQIGSDSSATALIGVHHNRVEDVYVEAFTTGWKLIHCRLIRFVRCSGWNNALTVANTALLITQAGGSTGDFVFEGGQFLCKDATTANTRPLHILSSNGAYNPATGVNLVSGIDFNGVDFYAGQRAIYIKAGGTSWIADIWFNHCQIDQRTTDGFYVESETSGSNVQNVGFLSGYISQTLGTAFLTVATGTLGAISNVRVNDCDINESQAWSGRIFNGDAVSFTNNRMRNQNYQAGAAIEVSAGSTNATVTGNVAFRNDGTSFMNYLVEIIAGATGHIVTGNNGGNLPATAVVLDNSGAVRKSVTGNI